MKSKQFVDIVKFKLSLKGFNLNIFKKTNIKQKLLDWRKKKALKVNLPQYCILKNNVIDVIAINRPKNKKQLLDVKGVGKKIAEKYGNEILKIVNS